MVFKPAYFEVNPHALDPKDISKGLDFSGVCPWVNLLKGDPKYSGRFGSSSPVNYSSNSNLASTLDEVAADDGVRHTQDQWIAYFNARQQLMASMSDIYLAGKSNDQRLLASLREDSKQSWIVTSTRLEYGAKEDAQIIHHYGSTVVKPIEHKLILPEYQPQLLDEVVNTPYGLNYLQVLFGTTDSTREIKDTLQKLSEYSKDKIKVWSASLAVRPDSRASGFGCGDSGFHVTGNYLDDAGCSRRVHFITP